MHYHWGQTTAKKRYVVALNSAYQAKKECWQRLVRKAAVWLTYLLLNLVNQEDILKNSNPISSSVTTSKWVLSTEWTRTWPSIGIRMKKWWWFPFFIQGVWVLHRINKDESDESLRLLAFRRHFVNAIFLKNPKECRLFLSHLGIRNVPLDVYYDDTKHYQVQSEHKRYQNTFKHLRGRIF